MKSSDIYFQKSSWILYGEGLEGQPLGGGCGSLGKMPPGLREGQ